MEYDPAIFQAQIVRTVLKLQSNWKDSRPLSLFLDLKDGVERKKRGRKRKSGKKRREKRWRRVLIKRGIGFTLDTKKLGRVRSFSI